MSLARSDATVHVDATPALLTLREHLRAFRGTVVAISAIVAGMFISTVTLPYAFSDDYSLLWMAVSGQPSAQFGKTIFDMNATMGRPLAGVVLDLSYSLAGTIDNLRFVRLVAIAAIVALAVLLHWALVRAGIDATPAALIAVCVCSMPAFQIYAGWAVLAPDSYALLFGSGASLLAAASIDRGTGRRAGPVAGGVVLLLAAIFIYQPSAMFYWVFLAVALVGARDAPKRAISLVRAHLGIAGGAFVLAYLSTKVMDHLLRGTATGGSRIVITHDIVGKARWFVEQPLYQSLSLFHLSPSLPLADVVGVVAAGGILMWLSTYSRCPLAYFAAALVLIPLTYFPNLVVPDDWAAFRTQAALSSLIVLYVCLGAIGAWIVIRDQLDIRGPALQRALLLLAGAFVAVCVFAASKNVLTYIVQPQNAELRLLRNQVAALPTGTRRVIFVTTSWYGGMTGFVGWDEFGLPSSARPWVLGPSIDLVLREEGRITLRGPQPVVTIFGYNSTIFPAGVPVIDLRAALRSLR